MQEGQQTPVGQTTGHSSLRHLDHRPWPLPSGSWQWRQRWLDLGFIHYRVAAGVLRPLIPPELEIDTFDGTAWVSVVPFTMADLMWRNLPSIPPLNHFPELNLRTYVHADGKAGVWFFSLDADCLPIVLGARYFHGIPYFRAAMIRKEEDDGMVFQSHRRCDGTAFRARFQCRGPIFFSGRGSLEEWLTERYCLYAVRGRTLRRLEVHHEKWPLQSADFQIERYDLLERAGIVTLDTPPLFHFSPGVDVVTFQPERLERV
ncbi:MAG: YqjF family protein [Verrucomicrobiales bacterium]